MRILILALLIACSSSDGPGNKLPAETWAEADHIKAGMPAPDHAWTPEEHARASEVLIKEATGHLDRLPRMDSAKSGAVFERMIEKLPDDGTAGVQPRFFAHMTRYDATNHASKLYFPSELAAPNREWLAMMGVLLQESAVLATLVDPLLASFGPDDPDREVRLGGLHKMKQGWAAMIIGGLGVLVDVRVPERDRVAFANDMRETVPTLYAMLDAPARDQIRDGLRKLHDGLKAGALRDALPAVPAR